MARVTWGIWDLKESYAFNYYNVSVHLHRACHIIGLPNHGPRAMVGSRREANKSQSLIAIYYIYNPFLGGMHRTSIESNRIEFD
jgi:hypothetical protein